MEIVRPTVLVHPTNEPLTLAEVKAHCYVAASDTSHDEMLLGLIKAARQEWEHDTDSSVLTQTLQIKLRGFYDSQSVDLPSSPIQSISSITYFDSTNTQQTLGTSIYSLDVEQRKVRLNYMQLWPMTLVRWDAVTITYIAGYTSRQLVPEVAKAAMKLLVGYYFDANRGDNDRVTDKRAYHSLVTKFMRSSYP